MATEAQKQDAPYGWPSTDHIETKGNVIYHESSGTWNTLRLNRRITWEFPLLTQKGKPVSYRAVLPRSIEKIKEMLAKVTAGKIPPPLMLFFFEAQNG